MPWNFAYFISVLIKKVIAAIPNLISKLYSKFDEKKNEVGYFMTMIELSIDYNALLNKGDGCLVFELVLRWSKHIDDDL